MRVGFDKAHFGDLADLWNRVSPTQYAVDAKLIRQNTVGCKQFDWGASIIQVEGGKPVGLLAVKRSASNLYRGPDDLTAHVNSLIFEDPLVGVDLMAYAKKILRNRGIDRLKFGQDVLHFFPGCPVEWNSLHDFLIVEGFEDEGEQHDLERDLADFDPDPKVLKPLTMHGEDSSEKGPVVRALDVEDSANLFEFLHETFPGRWAHDIALKVEREGSPSGVYALFIDNAIRGFASTQSEADNFPISGAVWKSALGPNWCSLGPIGIAEEFRGKGLGEALLAAALLGLKSKGGRRCLIDWTTLDDFYGRQGFEVTRRYSTMTLKL